MSCCVNWICEILFHLHRTVQPSMRIFFILILYLYPAYTNIYVHIHITMNLRKWHFKVTYSICWIATCARTPWMRRWSMSASAELNLHLQFTKEISIHIGVNLESFIEAHDTKRYDRVPFSSCSDLRSLMTWVSKNQDCRIVNKTHAEREFWIFFVCVLLVTLFYCRLFSDFSLQIEMTCNFKVGKLKIKFCFAYVTTPMMYTY